MVSANCWSSGMALLGCLCLVGCGSSVLLDPEGYHGGVVRYHYKQHQSPMLSSNRSEAFQKMREFCGGPYTIIKEGPTQGRKRVTQGFGPEEVIMEEWWGIRFTCKEAGG
jgi:hypothetical protein